GGPGNDRFHAFRQPARWAEHSQAWESKQGRTIKRGVRERGRRPAALSSLVQRGRMVSKDSKHHETSMQIPDIPVDEARRLTALHATRLLGSAPEEAFDRITRMAARLLN